VTADLDIEITEGRVLANVTLTNLSSKTVRLTRGEEARLEWQHERFEVSQSGRRGRLRGEALCCLAENTIELGPNESKRESFDLSSWFDLRRGTFSVRYVFHSEAGDVESNSVAFRVPLEPTLEERAEAVFHSAAFLCPHGFIEALANMEPDSWNPPCPCHAAKFALETAFPPSCTNGWRPMPWWLAWLLE
jgi:hypothetical protein